jgi:glycosyltransferase involved in cell wall biosynthesis
MSELRLSEQKRHSSSGELPLASIIITNYNYEKFLSRAIDSALQQTYPMKEIIVVDDGSMDNSRHIINSYGDQIMPVLQENRGVTSATNAGFLASRGEIIFLLDADDIFSPHKVETMVNYFLQVMPQNPAVMIFHRLKMTTDDGIVLQVTSRKKWRTLYGERENSLFEKLSDPEAAYRYVKKWGFLPSITSPTSGISLTRALASRVFPLPEERIFFQDNLLAFASMLMGPLYGVSQVLGSYVIQGKNVSLTQTFWDKENQRHQITENFLNDILQHMNKKRIISFFGSRHARPYYMRCGSTKGLLKLAYKVPARCFCWGAIWFSLRTFRHCINFALGITKKPKQTKRENQLAEAKKRQTKQHSQR